MWMLYDVKLAFIWLGKVMSNYIIIQFYLMKVFIKISVLEKLLRCVSILIN